MLELIHTLANAGVPLDSDALAAVQLHDAARAARPGSGTRLDPWRLFRESVAAGDVTPENVHSAVREAAFFRESAPQVHDAVKIVEAHAEAQLKSWTRENFDAILEALAPAFAEHAAIVRKYASKVLAPDASREEIASAGKPALEAERLVNAASAELDKLRTLIEEAGSSAGHEIGSSMFVNGDGDVSEITGWLDAVNLGFNLAINTPEQAAEQDRRSREIAHQREEDMWAARIADAEQRQADLLERGISSSISLIVPEEFRHLRTSPPQPQRRGRRIAIG